MKKLVIIGVGGFGREVAWLIERFNAVNPNWNLIGFIDDNEKLHGSLVGGYPVLGSCDWLNQNKKNVYAVCAIGSAKIRKNVIEKLNGVRFATLIDPNAIISDRVRIGEGSIICAGNIITVDIEIGTHVIVNLDCTIGHDVVLRDFVTIYPGVNISGNTILEESVEMGTGSQIIQGLRVGEGTIVGAGAVVVKELPKECTAVGSPARVIKYNEQH
nr:acetyltransferase [Sedimentibacter sp.]